MARRPYSTTLFLVCVAILASLVPGVYLLQEVVRHMGWRRPSLTTDWTVTVNEQNPARYAAILAPTPTPPGAPVFLRFLGSARLWQPEFPWTETPFTADVVMEVAAVALTANPPPLVLSTDWGALRFTYSERYLAARDAVYAPAPCVGTMHVSRLDWLRNGTLTSWNQVQALEGDISLRCLGQGSRSPAAVQWDIQGTIRTEWTRGEPVPTE